MKCRQAYISITEGFNSFKVNKNILFLFQHFRGRKNRCYKLAVRNVRRAFVKSTQARKQKKRFLRAVNSKLLSVNIVTGKAQN